MNDYIESVHKENLCLIKKHGIVKGTKLLNKSSSDVEVVDYTHALYGWIKTTEGDSQKVPQRVSEMLKGWDVICV